MAFFIICIFFAQLIRNKFLIKEINFPIDPVSRLSIFAANRSLVEFTVFEIVVAWMTQH